MTRDDPLPPTSAMHVVVEVLSGPFTGGCFQISHGGKVSFSRSQAAQFVIPDLFLSNVHFSLEYAAFRCTVRDLGSSNGTFINGVRVTEYDIRPGDTLQAGQTRFRVRLETEQPASPDVDTVVSEPAPPTAISEEWGRFPPAQAALLSALYSSDEPVFAVLDAAREDRIPSLLQTLDTEHLSLFEGREAEVLRSVAPYVASLPRDSRLLDPLLNEGLGKRWGIFL